MRPLRRVAPVQRDTVYYGTGFGDPRQMEEIVSTAITNVRTGEATAASACEDAQQQLEDMLVQFREELIAKGKV